MVIELILVVKGSSSSVATATVISTLLNVEQQLLKPEAIKQLGRLKRESVIILFENQLNFLAALRRRGFEGAVLVLSSEPFDMVKARHSILRYGRGFHQGCKYPWKLSDLLEKINILKPISLGNLRKLQSQLRANAEQLNRKVIPHYQNLQEGIGNFSQELDKMEENFNSLLRSTPVFRHLPFDPTDADPSQIQEKFAEIVQQIRKSQQCQPLQMAHLNKIFERWRNHVLDTGEGW